MLREVELAAVRMIHAHMDNDRRSVTIDLPSSKADPKGTGAKRTWDCTCSGLGKEPGMRRYLR